MIWKIRLRTCFCGIELFPQPYSPLCRIVRGKVNPLIEQWQRICILAERIIKRREAAAVRMPAFRRTYHSAHPALPFSSSSAPVSPTSSSNRTVNSLLTTIFSLQPAFGDTQQGDLARLTNTVRAVVEVNENCWRGDECDLSSGVKAGLEQAAAHFQRHAELSELRVGRRASIWVGLSANEVLRRECCLTLLWKRSRCVNIVYPPLASLMVDAIVTT